MMILIAFICFIDSLILIFTISSINLALSSFLAISYLPNLTFVPSVNETVFNSEK